MLASDAVMGATRLGPAVDQLPVNGVVPSMVEMRFKELPKGVDTTYLDKVFFDREGKFVAHPASDVQRYDRDHIQLWCHVKGRYNVPTVEQIDRLKSLIGDRKTIEIGAGMGDLGPLLGIPMTDSHIQTTPEMRLYYASLRQPIIEPPPSVEKLDAIEAIKKYKPSVVVAAWVTQLFQDGDSEAKIGSSIVGVDEAWVLEHCETYIFVGNEDVHKDKRIFRREHRTIQSSTLVSRAFDQSKNAIWVWGKT